MLNAEELIKAEMMSSTFNKVEFTPKLPKPGTRPWMKYGIVLGAIIIAAGAAYLIARNDSKQKLKQTKDVN